MTIETVYRVEGKIYDTLDEAEKAKHIADKYNQFLDVFTYHYRGENDLDLDAVKLAIQSGELVYNPREKT